MSRWEDFKNGLFEPVSKKKTPGRFKALDQIGDAFDRLGVTVIALSLLGAWIAEDFGASAGFLGAILGAMFVTVGIAIQVIAAKIEAKEEQGYE